MPDLLSQVKSLLSTTPTHWTGLTGALPAGLLARPAGPGEWSAVDCLGHLLDTEQMVFPVRLRAFLAGDDAFPAFDPDSESNDRSGMTPPQLAADFARQRAENMSLLEQVTPDILSRTANHAELGPVTLEQLLHEWAAHDLNHTVQAERALMQAFIPGSGPWRHYFADHDRSE